MNVNLGINTGFALNRFSSPQEWIPLVADIFGLKKIQFTADLLNPSLPDEIIDEQVATINALTKKHNVVIEQTFTSAFTRVNHLAHPDAKIRDYWVNWFCRYVDISVALGAKSMGSHFGILTVRDNADPEIKKQRFQQNVEGWKKIADHAASKGMDYLLWEPMSIPREMGETIVETKRVHYIVNQDIALPMKLCLDVDHGDVSSDNPADTDPYAWIRAFAKEAPVIHLKQTLRDKGGHWPFIPEKNKNGKIIPEEFLQELEKAGVEEVILFFEFSFREREPFESRVISDIKASVEYWKPFVNI
ncbi:MAG: TIM barrel protein [Candidatus Omnitrophica bacterium]|nr:TIM barrel protein [Candidatus Omnitrophota bacterium]